MCEDGPLLVRGPVRVLGPDGEEVPRSRATVAVCRCGLTGRAPWCDGSHKVAARRADRQPASSAGELSQDPRHLGG